MREKASGHTFARRRASGSRGSRAMTPAYLGRRTRHAGATHWGGGQGALRPRTPTHRQARQSQQLVEGPHIMARGKFVSSI